MQIINTVTTRIFCNADDQMCEFPFKATEIEIFTLIVNPFYVLTLTNYDKTKQLRMTVRLN
jgi:hypothetical protein